MEHPEIAATLMCAELFEGLDPRVIDHVAGIADRRSIPPGQHVFFEGDIATEFYVVESGCVRVYIPSRGDELDAATVRDGQMFGEGGLLDGGPRLASALALEPTTLLAVRREPWLAVMRSEPALALRVFSAFGAALRRYVGHMVESLFLDVEVPDAPPPPGEQWPGS